MTKMRRQPGQTVVIGPNHAVITVVSVADGSVELDVQVSAGVTVHPNGDNLEQPMDPPPPPAEEFPDPSANSPHNRGSFCGAGGPDA